MNSGSSRDISAFHQDSGPYRRPLPLCNAHLETICPALLRRPPQPAYRRERISTLDDDFLDLDWIRNGHGRLAIISHGLEGDSRRGYMIGMANALCRREWDVLAWNFRGCSGEINRQPRFTHNGSTDDLDRVVRHAVDSGYRRIVLVGFSMGGNLSLVYLGRGPENVPAAVKAAVVFSVPCDLAAGAEQLALPANRLYMHRFLRLMKRKVRMQALNFPDLFSIEGYGRLQTFHDFDGRYTAPLHGFRDAHDYWTQSSSLRYLPDIRLPVWIVNAANDPFLAESCFPHTDNPQVSLLTPEHGGHCGFTRFGHGGEFWSEQVAAELLNPF
ncbi:MAG TPA: alpha/beta fold hydrolase [Desulfuromonadales bacterium]|nr:alpha/beta fold hydrolase [Desulfuromonadales bacterium]